MNRRDIVVVGASAGGVFALRKLLSSLPRNFPAAVFIVLHVGSNPSILPDVLAATSPNAVAHASDGEMFHTGRIYVAPPDHHMLMSGDHVQLTRGPKEHHTRPAIDPLFRSAALAHGSRVVGVVLTGSMDDGTAGLQAIKQCGGLAMVQDPREADYPGMPQSALDHVDVDRCLRIDELAQALVDLAGQPVEVEDFAPQGLQIEHAASLADRDAMEELNEIGTPSLFVCPDCQGTLWGISGAKPPRYRCHTGHAFTLRTLQEAMSNATEQALWSAIRALQEKSRVLRRGAELEHDPEARRAAASHAERVEEQASTLRKLV